MEGTDSEVPLPIVAIYEGPDALGPNLMPLNSLPARASSAQHAPRLESVLVQAAPGRATALQQEVKETLDNPALLVHDRADAGRGPVRSAHDGGRPAVRLAP